jgi:murein tripeptide amidase MpaA
MRVSAASAVASAILLLATLGVAAGALPSGVAAGDYPPRDVGYHSFKEMAAYVKSVAAAYPHIVRVFSVGKSHEGRKLWAAEISDNPGTDEGEPEVLFDGLHHAREHLSAEMAIDVLDLLTSQYNVRQRVTRLVNERRTWIVFMVNPDGLEHDLTGHPYRDWRKNREPSPESRGIGTDLNRNYGYRFGCCGASSGSPGSVHYRGPRPWSAPEVRAMRDFVQSRVVYGRQRIRTHISFHTAGELVLWPYGYTHADVPADMTRLDARAFGALGRAMAATNGYTAKQSSAMYVTDGDMIDWMYGTQRVFSFTFELYPRGGDSRGRHYPPDEIIGRETRRNRDAVLYLMAKAACPWSALGREAARANCGPLFDDLEIDRGWRLDAGGIDRATQGRWSRGDASAGALQLGSAISGSAVLVTGRRAGEDVDRGRTTVRSPLFLVPADGRATVRLRYWVGFARDATRRDGLRVHLVDAAGTRLATVASVSGTGQRRAPSWRTMKAPVPPGLAGIAVSIELAAVDAKGDSTVEVGIDEVRVTAD